MLRKTTSLMNYAKCVGLVDCLYDSNEINGTRDGSLCQGWQLALDRLPIREAIFQDDIKIISESSHTQFDINLRPYSNDIGDEDLNVTAHLLIREIGPFPSDVILHSYMGSAELVSGFSKLGAYFSFSGYLTSMKSTKSKKMLKAVATDRILLESDAPDGLPKVDTVSLLTVRVDDSSSQDEQIEELNHPANIHTVLNYVATMLEMPEEEVAEMSYQNAICVFTFPGSKLSGLC